MCCPCPAGRGMEREAQGGWGLSGEPVRDRDRGGGPPSPSAPPPMAILPRSTVRGDTGEGMGLWLASRTRLSTGYRHALPPPLEGGGGAPKVRVGWGIIEESYGAETGRARTRQRQGRGAGPPYPSSNDVTPKISSRGRSGTAFVYIRAVSKTGTIPCRRASATAAAFGSGVSM